VKLRGPSNLLIPLGFRARASQFHSCIFDRFCFSAFLVVALHPSPLFLSILHNFKPFIGFQVAFAPKPIFHRGLQLIHWNAVSCLQNPVGNRKRVIENRIVGEIPHGKVVNLPNRACVALACGVDSVHRKSPREHGFNGNEWGEITGTAMAAASESRENSISG
jgi:hypothetical protein